MLAGPKTKVNFSTVLTPRESHWSKDDNKIGQKLLEKMGWAKGKGLGVREDGVSEAIRLPVKLNSEGIGYKETDNTHELADEYEKVLASLNQKYRSNNSSASSSVCEEEEGSGKESQSSQRPIRVRHRYTKIRTAKDASSYSQEDLNIIFAVKKSDSSLPSSPSTATSSSSEEKITNSNDKSSKNKDKKSIKKRKVDDDDVNRCGDASQSLSPLVRTSTLSNDSHYSRDGKSCDSVVESTETHHQTQTSTKKRIHKEEVEQYEKKNLPQSPEDSPSPTIDEILPGGYKLSSDREKTILEDYPILVGKIKDDKAWKTSNFLSIKGYGRKDTKRDCDQVDSRNEEAINGTIRKNKRKR